MHPISSPVHSVLHTPILRMRGQAAGPGLLEVPNNGNDDKMPCQWNPVVFASRGFSPFQIPAHHVRPVAVSGPNPTTSPRALHVSLSPQASLPVTVRRPLQDGPPLHDNAWACRSRTSRYLLPFANRASCYCPPSHVYVNQTGGVQATKVFLKASGMSMSSVARFTKKL